MATDRDRQRCRERLEMMRTPRLRLDPEEFSEEAIGALRRAIGFDGPSCWILADPATALPARHEVHADEGFEATIPRLTAIHQGYGAATDRAAFYRDTPTVTIGTATRGDYPSSQIWDECFREHGIGDCFFLSARDRHGGWGWINASRASSEAPFTTDDIRLLDDVSSTLAASLRILATGAPESTEAPPPGVIVCDDRLHEESWTPAAHDWLAQLPDGPHWLAKGLLPTAVYGVVGRLLAEGAEEGTVARTRVRTAAGTWAVLDGSRLEGAAGGKVAITIRAATPGEVLDLLSRAYGLSPRETQLVRLVVGGMRTSQLAERLFITPYTVQDHLKAVFEKVGVRSRGELVSRITGHAGVTTG